jgi:hypothetical protein
METKTVAVGALLSLGIFLTWVAYDTQQENFNKYEQERAFSGLLKDGVVRLRITLDSERARFAFEKAQLFAKKERFLDEMMEAENTASDCRIKMNEVYGDPGWPVSDPLHVSEYSKYMWLWELACGPDVGETTCTTCLDDLNDCQYMADGLIGGCEEVRQEDIQAACAGNCNQARAAKGRYRRELEISKNNGEYWSAEALKLREKYEPDKVEEDKDG